MSNVYFFNDKIKYFTICELLSKDSLQLRALIRTQPTIFKGKSIKTKAKSKDYRNWVFNTKFFQENAFSIIEKSIQIYNEKEFTNRMLRTIAEF